MQKNQNVSANDPLRALVMHICVAEVNVILVLVKYCTRGHLETRPLIILSNYKYWKPYHLIVLKAADVAINTTL